MLIIRRSNYMCTACGIVTVYEWPWCSYVEWFWNLMAHAQKTDFVFRPNGRFHLNRWGRQFSRLMANWGLHISGSNVGYTMFRGSVKSTGYPLHSPVSPSLPLPCVTVCHQVSNALYTQSVYVRPPRPLIQSEDTICCLHTIWPPDDEHNTDQNM